MKIFFARDSSVQMHNMLYIPTSNKNVSRSLNIFEKWPNVAFLSFGPKIYSEVTTISSLKINRFYRGTVEISG